MMVGHGAFLRNAVADAYFPLYKEIMPMAFRQNRHKLFFADYLVMVKDSLPQLFDRNSLHLNFGKQKSAEVIFLLLLNFNFYSKIIERLVKESDKTLT